MSIDYNRLVGGLIATAEMVNDGRTGLAAIDSLVATAREATGATGATFTEYGDEDGRVVVANGAMAWALGQPVAAEFIDRDVTSPPWIGPVDRLPSAIFEPLAVRGVAAMAGHPVRGYGRLFGSIHVYFGGDDRASAGEGGGADHVGGGDGRASASEGGGADHVGRGDDRASAGEGGGLGAGGGRAAGSNGLSLAEVGPVLRLVAGSIAHVYGDAHPPPTGTVDRDDRPLFLAVAGHELRTPVTVVKGYASMLSQRWDTLDEPNRRAAASVLSQRADELARLVDRLLGASVGDGAAGWLVRSVPFDPVEALRRAAEELPEELRRPLRLELPNSLPPASGDPAILTSIVGELVTNAVRYTDRDSGAQVVELQAGADTQTVFVRVCDRGIGIDPADVERAFERFWRARREGGGVGLGLFLVRRLVERQGGWVSLRPREGGGTVAEVRLPRADAPKTPWVPST